MARHRLKTRLEKITTPGLIAIEEEGAAVARRPRRDALWLLGAERLHQVMTALDVLKSDEVVRATELLGSDRVLFAKAAFEEIESELRAEIAKELRRRDPDGLSSRHRGLS